MMVWTVPAAADLPPPEGTKFVDYQFKLEGADAQKDWVVFAYPYSTSNGAPTREYTVVSDGKPVTVGRRSPSPKLYAMPRSAHETWAKGYDEEKDDNSAVLDALVKRPDVLECRGAPSPRYQLPKEDKRDSIVETLKVVKLGKDGCEVTTHLAAPDPAPSPAPAPAPTPTADPTPSPSDNPTSPTPKSGGCGSCGVGTSSNSPSAAWSALLLAGALLTRRRRR